MLSDRPVVNGCYRFQWKLTGLQPGGDPNNPEQYYGGYIEVRFGDETGNVPNLPEGITLRFTLTPAVPLIDGSNGQTAIRERTAAAMRTARGPVLNSSRLEDIPIGPYRITGELSQPGGRATPLRMGTSGTPTNNSRSPWTSSSRRRYASRTPLSPSRSSSTATSGE
ncbi:MAG: hypothetical protein M3272_11035 [Actinomycetota bacterium]|nr:hypothetical protein [Actinomycetota bacterium]